MTDQPESGSLSRRRFLVLSIGATAAVALPNLTGCTNQPVVTPATPVAASPAAGSPTTIASPTTAALGGARESPQPYVIRSQNGVLKTSLLIKNRDYTLPASPTPTPRAKPQTLRSYGYPKPDVPQPDPNNEADWIWSFPGPTWRVKRGDRLQIKLYNYLPAVEPVGACEPEFYPTATPSAAPLLTPTTEPDSFPNCFHENNATNLHFHGLHVDQGPRGDNVFLTLYPQGQVNPTHEHGEIVAIGSYDFDFVIPDDHPQGTYWYHPHKHGATDLQVANGMAGTLIIEDDLAADPAFKNVPLTEHVFVVQKLASTLAFPSGASGSGMQLVNGQLDALIAMKVGEVQRWRIVNATGQASSALNVSIEGEPSTTPDMFLIAVDGVFLTQERWNTRQPLKSLFVAPGNRIDVLVQAKTAGSFRLQGRPGQLNQLRRQATPTPVGNTLAAATALFNIEVTGRQDPPMGLPAQLPVLPANLDPIPTVDKTRTLTFDMLGGQQGGASSGNAPVFVIDRKKFDPCVVNHCVVLNSSEEWTIINNTTVAHPFHIHLNPFLITAYNDPNPDDPNNPITTGDNPVGQWQDTILVPAMSQGTPGSVTIRHRFPDITGKYVLHCHILGHEDRGMMQVVEVVPSEAACSAPICT